MLNTAVSLGRAGIRVEFIGEIADDLPGELILRFLKDNHVGTKFVDRYHSGKTTLALAFLNEKADADYSFYADLPKKRLNVNFPVTTAHDIVLFGSFYSLMDGIHDWLKTFLTLARQNQTLILYDPNFRKDHSKELNHVMPLILENLFFADIIRGSNEDFLHIFAIPDPKAVYTRIRRRDNQVLIYTKSYEPVSVLVTKQTISVPVPVIEPVSTVGAGDAFNAGLIEAMIGVGVRIENLENLSRDEWKQIAVNAICFSQNVCMSFDNYIRKDFLFLD